MYGQTDRWMDEWTDRQMDVWTDGWMDEQRQTDGWTNRDRQMDGQQLMGCAKIYKTKI